MPKEKPKKREKRIERRYNYKHVELAIEEVRLGQPLRHVATKYNIPPSTLHSKISNVYAVSAKKGPATILSKEDEGQLVEWILFTAERGFPVTKEQLLNSVKWIVLDRKQDNPFTNNKPGRHWYQAFLRRHPELSSRTCQNLTYSRASVTEADLRKWFSTIEKYFTDKNLQDLDGSRIFNGDESGFRLSPDAGMVMARRGSKSVYKIVGGNEKEQITSLFLYNAEGRQAPPLVLFRYHRLPPSIAAGFPRGWSIGKTDNGWMTSESFYEYIVNVFHPWLLKEKIKLSIILYMDGHSSHFTLPLSQFCQSHEIILIALYPNATHVIQPLDRALFRPLKKSWAEEVDKYKSENRVLQIRKEDFGNLLKSALDKLDMMKIMENGFRVSGLFPFDVDAVDYSLLKCNNEKIPETSGEQECIENPPEGQQLKEIEKAVQILEKNLDAAILHQFKESEAQGRWIGSIENKGLFNLWLKMTEACGSSTNRISNVNYQNIVDDKHLQEKSSLVDLDAINNLSSDSIVILDIEGEIIDGEFSLSDTALLDITNEITKTNVEELALLKSSKTSLADNISKQIPCTTTISKVLTDQIIPNGEDVKDVPTRHEIVKKIDYQKTDEEPYVLNDIVPLLNPTDQTQCAPDNSTVVSLESATAPQTSLIPPHIKSPFKRILTWPQAVKPKQKKSTSIGLPSVATSDDWITLHQIVEEEKRKKSAELEARKKVAAEKKLLKQQKQLEIQQRKQKQGTKKEEDMKKKEEQKKKKDKEKKKKDEEKKKKKQEENEIKEAERLLKRKMKNENSKNSNKKCK